jgi:glycosyltransferase involved in cell wall biosynthesis
MPRPVKDLAGGAAERSVLRIVQRFYKIARLVMAPNPELAEMLRLSTGKPVHLMLRGVDTSRFSPSKRTVTDGRFRMGFVGRLSPEKNVRFLAALEKALLAEHRSGFRFLIVGDGSELDWLKRNLVHADFTGVLRGEPLSEAYANMDAFVFPSQSDTFGNVVLEAHAAGVPAVVTRHGGPKFLVQHGVSGFIANDEAGFVRSVLALMTNPARRNAMGQAARLHAESRSWDRVMEDVFKTYALAASDGITNNASPSSGVLYLYDNAKVLKEFNQ